MESIKEVVEEKVDAVLESKKEEIKDKVEEAVEKVDEVADKVCEKIEAEVGRLVLMKPEVAKAVELVDEALVGKALTCGCLGWTFSAVKSRKMKATQ